MLRITLSTIGFVSILFFSPVVALLSAFVLVLMYRAWEVLLLGLLADLLWASGSGGWSFVPYCTILAILMVWLAEPLRSAFLNS